jgi:tRNA(His) 5'-end guanylyltransferase
MRFDDLEARMRPFEAANEHRVQPGLFIVVRLDGRGFTKLTKKDLELDRPYDLRFSDWMVTTAEHLMTAGLKVVYGYTQSDEISLLLDPRDESFGRRVEKLVSVLAGEASARLSLLASRPAAFDCRLSTPSSAEDVADYFLWRAEDAARNALNSHCYWMLRGDGLTARAATSALAGLTAPEKHEMLFVRGTNFGDLPAWMKRGVGLWWERRPHSGLNPLTGERVETTRLRLRVERELPRGAELSALVRGLVEGPRPAG